MSNNVLSYLVAGTLGVTLALVSPALAFHGGGGGGMHGGGMAGGMHVGSWVAAWAEARISAEAISRAGPLQHMLHSPLGSQGLGSEITASSIPL